MKALFWLMIACAGFALMAWSYFGYQRIDESTPWACGLMLVANAEVNAETPLPEFSPLWVKARLLPLDPLGETLANALGTEHNLRAALSEKLLRLAPQDAGITESLLEHGRLPAAGSDEVVAGYRTAHHERLMVADRELTVVGVLRRDAAVLGNAYLAAPAASLDTLFDPDNAAVRNTGLLQLLPQQAHGRQALKQLAEAYPSGRFAMIAPEVRAEPAPYYLYVAGQALLLLGGSGFLIAMYAALARRVHWQPLERPLDELSHRRGLLWTVHLVYFGLTIFGALVIYSLPQLQTTLLAMIREVMKGDENVLAVAAHAYASGNMLWAALVTLVINFFIGSVLCITVPSVVIPGIGVLLAAWRALLWGALLAPSVATLARGMLPHSGTLLLEGEGYILAAFFALLIPTYLCQPRLGGGMLHRYGRAVLLNAQGALLTFVVLAVAGCYEAVEVILQTP
jgi:hypothetical protein